MSVCLSGLGFLKCGAKRRTSMELPIKFPCGARNSVCLFVNSWGFCCEGLHVPESMFLGVIRPGDVFFFYRSIWIANLGHETADFIVFSAHFWPQREVGWPDSHQKIHRYSISCALQDGILRNTISWIQKNQKNENVSFWCNFWH